MSEVEKTKKEMIKILEQIPASGSYEGAELVLKVSELSKRMHTMASALNSQSAPEVEPSSVPASILHGKKE